MKPPLVFKRSLQCSGLMLLLLSTSACQGKPTVETSAAEFKTTVVADNLDQPWGCLLYTSPSPRDS